MLYICRIVFVCLLAVPIYAQSRCVNYVQRVKLAHYEVFGIDYPYWYGVGQLEQESRCRNVLSRDGVGSQGLPQITYRIWNRYLSKHNIPDINTIGNQLRAQAWIMYDCKKQAYSSHLWVAYQIYNGGSLVNKEIKRARNKYDIREVPHSLARQFCRRRVIHFNNGQSISACNINYDYSKKVYKYGNKYKIYSTNKMRFW